MSIPAGTFDLRITRSCANPTIERTVWWLDDVLNGQEFPRVQKLGIEGFGIEVNSMLAFDQEHAGTLQSITLKKCSVNLDADRTQLTEALSTLTDTTTKCNGLAYPAVVDMMAKKAC